MSHLRDLRQRLDNFGKEPYNIAPANSGGMPYRRGAAAKCGWPIEPKAWDQSRERIEKEVECLSKISVKRRRRKREVEMERLARKPN